MFANHQTFWFEALILMEEQNIDDTFPELKQKHKNKNCCFQCCTPNHLKYSLDDIILIVSIDQLH